MKTLVLIMALVVATQAGCRQLAPSEAVLKDEVLSGNMITIKIDPATFSKPVGFWGQGNIPYAAYADQAWGPNDWPTAYVYVGLLADQVGAVGKSGYVFQGPSPSPDGTGGGTNVEGWYRLMPKATAVTLTHKFRINAKLHYNLLAPPPHFGGVGARIFAGCMTDFGNSTGNFWKSNVQRGDTDGFAMAGWQHNVVQLVTEPLDLSKCVDDVYMSFEVGPGKVQVFDPEVQLLEVTEG